MHTYAWNVKHSNFALCLLCDVKWKFLAVFITMIVFSNVTFAQLALTAYTGNNGIS